MTHAQFKELLPLHVVGALDGVELREFEQYVAVNRALCEAEIAVFENTANQLAYAAPQATASAQVLDRIMAAIEMPAPQRVERREPARFVWLPWALTAAACVALLFAYTLGNSHKEASAMRAQIRHLNIQLAEREQKLSEFQKTAEILRADVSELKAQNESLNSEKTTLMKATYDLQQRLNRQDVLMVSLQKTVNDQSARMDVLMDPGVRVAQMADPEHRTKATAKVFWHEQKQSGVVVVSNVSPVLQGDPKTLELWLICEGQAPIPAGLFFTDKSGHGIGEIKLARQVACAPKFAVSVEPAAGVDAPTGPIVLLGQ